MKKWIWGSLAAAVVIAVICLLWLPKRLEFSYEIEKTEYAPGDKVKVTVLAKNVGRSIRYKGGGSYMVYFYTDVDGQRYDIDYTNWFTNHDATTYVWKWNEVRSKTLTYSIPEDAPAGKYSLFVTFEGVNYEFADVIEIN